MPLLYVNIQIYVSLMHRLGVKQIIVFPVNQRLLIN